MVSMPSSLRRGSTYRRSQNISIAYIIFLPLLAFISFTRNFSAPFFSKKHPGPLDKAYSIAFPQTTPINVNKKLKMKNEK